MNPLDSIETAMVERLKAAMPRLMVQGFPDRPDHFHCTHPVGVALVCYRGSAFGAPVGAGAIQQERTLRFEITLMVRNLRDHGGAYEHLEAARMALMAWVPIPGFQGCWIEQDGFVHQAEGLWQWRLMVATRGYAFCNPVDESGPFLVSVTPFLENT